MSILYNSSKGKRSIFTPREDAKLRYLVETAGRKLNWRTISFEMEGRTPRQCRERYNNYLNPNIQHKEWSAEEDEIILRQYAIVGSHWQQIASCLNGRTGNAIRNRYFSLTRQKKSLDSSNIQTEASSSESEAESKSLTEPDLLFAFETPIFNIPFDSIFFESA